MIIKSLKNIFLKWSSLVLIINFIASLQQCKGKLTDQANVVKISVQSQITGKEYKLALTKADKSTVLHNDIEVISAASTLPLPNAAFENKDNNWSSLKNKEDLYIDNENLAVVRLAYDSEKGEHYPISGIVNGNRLVKKAETDKFANIIDDRFPLHKNQSDYIDLGRIITPPKLRNGNIPAIVELVIVCDKEFGDKFNHDQQAILDYWTIYFWDINMRFRTLPNVQISFQLNSIIIISSTSEQPFIEHSRGSDGRTEHIRIIERFSKWVYSKTNVLPNFDVAVAVTNSQGEWDGGYAYYNSACWTDQSREKYWGTAVWNDAGDWRTVGVGAHELAHVLGARHDDDPKHACDSRGYIMMGRIGEKKWFFSPCSDRTIGEFVRSEQASCLRRLDETSAAPAVDPHYYWTARAPSMDEQCKKLLNNPNAKEDGGDCAFMKCWVQQPDGGWWYWSKSPVDNTPCSEGGRCFRGRCRGKGDLLVNMGSNECAIAENPFYHQTPLRMRECRFYKDTPLEQFVVEESRDGNGKYLSTPWNSKDGMENGDKCLYTGGSEGDGLWTEKCDKSNPWQGWEMNKVGGYEIVFLLRHKVTGRCAKQNDSWIGSHECDFNDRSMWWSFFEDLFTPVPVISG